MKKNILIIFILIIIALLPTSSKAASGKLSASDFEMECVYDNGVSISVYNDNSVYSMSSAEFKLSNSIQPPYLTSLTYFYNESEFAKMILDSMTCPNQIYQMIINQKDADGNSVSFQIFYRYEDIDKVMCCDSPYDEEFFKSQVIAGFTPTSGAAALYKVDKKSSLYSRGAIYYNGDKTLWGSFWFSLKSEKIYFNNDVEPVNQWAFKSEGTQAASNPTYIRLYEYKKPNDEKVYIAEKSNTITKLTNSSIDKHVDGKVMFACFNPSVKEIDTTKNEAAYKFSSVRHYFQYKGTKNLDQVVEGSNGYTCYSGSLYREVDWSEAEEAEDDATSICDVIPETSLLIAKVINYSRIFVPIFLIILTAFDITKIVLTGDINEELPKRRKLIIIRMVVAIAFFFIPIFIQVFVSSSYGVDFGDISCLW